MKIYKQIYVLKRAVQCLNWSDGLSHQWMCKFHGTKYKAYVRWFNLTPLSLSQAHPHLSGFLPGLRLFRLLWRRDRSPGARTRHHVLAQREMGLHRRALRFLTLRPQEICHQGDLSLLLNGSPPGCVQADGLCPPVLSWLGDVARRSKREDLSFPFSVPGLVLTTQQCLCNSVKEQKVS